MVLHVYVIIQIATEGRSFETFNLKSKFPLGTNKGGMAKNLRRNRAKILRRELSLKTIKFTKKN